MMDLQKIDEEIARLNALRLKAVEEDIARKKRDGLIEAREILARLVVDLKRLDELQYVPPRLREALTDERGNINPGLYIKRPRDIAAD